MPAEESACQRAGDRGDSVVGVSKLSGCFSLFFAFFAVEKISNRKVRKGLRKVRKEDNVISKKNVYPLNLDTPLRSPRTHGCAKIKRGFFFSLRTLRLNPHFFNRKVQLHAVFSISLCVLLCFLFFMPGRLQPCQEEHFDKHPNDHDDRNTAKCNHRQPNKMIRKGL